MKKQYEGREVSMKVAFIGGGNMGEAILAAILAKGLISKEAISVSDVSQTRRQYLGQKYGVTVVGDNRQAVSKGDIVVLAIKPQQLAEVMAELNSQLKPSQLALSIIAGTRISTLRRGLSHNHIVRVMPNTPAQIGKGMSVWTATKEVTEQQKEWAGAILGAMGREIYVDDEKYIDMATAVSGSGPAYVFLFAEALVDAAIHIGLSHDIAQELVLQTILGSTQFMQQSGKLPAEEKGQFTKLIKQAVIAAYNKAKELGN